MFPVRFQLEEWPPPQLTGHAVAPAAPGRAVEVPGLFYLRGEQNDSITKLNVCRQKKKQ